MALTNDQITAQNFKDFYNHIMPYLNGQPALNYSTDEQVVGTWIDGKPIYQKTVEITLPNCEEIGIPVYQALVNFDFAIDALIYIGGFFSISSAIMPIPFCFQQSDKWMSAVGARITISSGVYKLQIYNSNTNWNGATGYVTLQYTKPTD